MDRQCIFALLIFNGNVREGRIVIRIYMDKKLVIRVKIPLFPKHFLHNILRGKRRYAMKKIFNYYILTAKEMDEIQYTIDWYHKYKILAEREWKSDEKDAEVPE